ncbi:MAG: cupin domain-containing protein [Verrucomicrobiota bacterium]
MRTPLNPLATVIILAAALASPLSGASAEKAPITPLGSTSFIWDTLTPKPTAQGQRRDVVNHPTPTLARFQSHITTLNPGNASHPPHQHPLEEMIFLKEGQLEVTINGQNFPASPGSVLFYASNDFHSVRNVGTTPATYIVMNFGTAATATAPKERAVDSADPKKLRSQVFEWTKLPVKVHKTNERRDFFNAPTVTCENVSCHSTTVKAGEASHASHRHPDEEVVIVKEGTLEVLMNGKTERGGPGSIFFFASNEEHGMRNVGDTSATYYVIRVVTAATPKPPAKK